MQQCQRRSWRLLEAMSCGSTGEIIRVSQYVCDLQAFYIAVCVGASNSLKFVVPFWVMRPTCATFHGCSLRERVHVRVSVLKKRPRTNNSCDCWQPLTAGCAVALVGHSFLAQHAAIAYYWVLVAFFFFAPEKVRLPSTTKGRSRRIDLQSMHVCMRPVRRA